MSYMYWNQFVDQWSGLASGDLTATHPPHPPHILGWPNPNSVPLLNSTAPDDYSLKYIPEPWWGNSGDSPLHCVFLNHNPFKGGPVQTHPSIHGLISPLTGINNYQDFVNAEVSNFDGGIRKGFYSTCNWHKNNRSQQIRNALNTIAGHPICPDKLSSLLSIELVPWHTPNFGAIEFSYLLSNLNIMLINTLLFAANESRKVKNSVLNQKPIIRTNRSRIEQLLKMLVTNKLISGYALTPESVIHGPKFTYKWDTFTINQVGFSGIKFCRLQAFGNSLPGYNGTLDFLRRI